MKIGTVVTITDGIAKGLTATVVEDNLKTGLGTVVRIENPTESPELLKMVESLPDTPPKTIHSGVHVFYPDATKTNVKAWVSEWHLKAVSVA